MSIKRLEGLVNVRQSMINKESNEEVLSKYLEYLNEYDNLENKGVREKLEHRDLFKDYLRYTEMMRG